MRKIILSVLFSLCLLLTGVCSAAGMGSGLSKHDIDNVVVKVYCEAEETGAVVSDSWYDDMTAFVVDNLKEKGITATGSGAVWKDFLDENKEVSIARESAMRDYERFVRSRYNGELGIHVFKYKDNGDGTSDIEVSLAINVYNNSPSHSFSYGSSSHVYGVKGDRMEVLKKSVTNLLK